MYPRVQSMADTASYPRATATGETSLTDGSAAIPWHIWCCVAAVVSSAIGGLWDISWHKSIGRDTFWTPAHVLIYLCGVLAGLSCGYLILATTFGKNPTQRASSVYMWGFRGPLGAFICAWGGVAMITSAPFDNWWHEAYGLDVKILSPPHVLLALGMMAIRFGTLVMIVSQRNRATGELRAKLDRLLFFALLFLLGMTVGITEELINRVYMHGARFYLVLALAAPVWLAVASRVSSHRWAATIVPALYTALHLTFTWLLPLAPAEPKLGPIYQRVTHLVPPDFPLLLIVPALAIDLLRPRLRGWNPWGQSLALGTVFNLAFISVQWPFASFLMSPAARNWIFATENYPYFVPSTSPWVRNMFVPTEQSPTEFWVRMALALASAAVMARVGLAWGEWMRRLRR
jgi:hypothetical protein